MQAIINNVSYELLAHYAEQGNMVRLVIADNDISFDELRNGIKETEEILVIDDSGKTVATYIGYTKIRQLSMGLLDDISQIELVLELENVISSVENAQKKITNNTQAIENLTNLIEALTSDNEVQSGRIGNLEGSLESLTYDFTMFQQEIREQLATIQESIANAQDELDHIDAAVM